MIDYNKLQAVQPQVVPGVGNTPDDPTERPYRIKCFVMCKRITFQDEQSRGKFNNETVNVYLIPDQSTQMQLFLAAWLPEVGIGPDHHELAVLMGHPVNSPARCSIHRGNQHVPQPHLMVMSQEAEYALIRFFNAMLPQAKQNPYALRIDVTTLPGSQEQVLG